MLEPTVPAAVLDAALDPTAPPPSLRMLAGLCQGDDIGEFRTPVARELGRRGCRDGLCIGHTGAGSAA